MTKIYTREERYRRIEDMPQSYIDAQIQAVQSDKEFYPAYHIAPHFGLLNDPNGLCHFAGAHHIFYQYHPVAPTHGLKYWYHVSTKDFIHYQDHGIAVRPDQDMDAQGVFSGGALVDGDEAVLFYTCNKYDQDLVRHPAQAYLKMSADGTLSEKVKIIDQDPAYTGHFRDPKPWKKDGKYYLILGAQRAQDEKGTLVLYKADNLNDWKKVGDVDLGYDSGAFMYECPDYFELGDRGVVLFSPQGIKSNNKYDYQNIYNVIYRIADPMNLTSPSFYGGDFIEMDKGFDFYAPQTYEDQDGRRILIGWLGCSDVYYPLGEESRWSQMLTIPRELSVKNNILIQSPLKELESLRMERFDLAEGEHDLLQTSFELDLHVAGDFTLTFSNDKGDKIVFSANSDEYKLDRTEQSYSFWTEYGTVRYARRFVQTETIRIFVDKSSLEIFADQGQTVFTSRFYLKDFNKITLQNASGELHHLASLQYQ
ncbi:MAG: sucrose-6-phosphate hydrolase [Brevinema sp.]